MIQRRKKIPKSWVRNLCPRIQFMRWIGAEHVLVELSDGKAYRVPHDAIRTRRNLAAELLVRHGVVVTIDRRPAWQHQRRYAFWRAKRASCIPISTTEAHR